MDDEKKLIETLSCCVCARGVCTSCEGDQSFCDGSCTSLMTFALDCITVLGRELSGFAREDTGRRRPTRLTYHNADGTWGIKGVDLSTIPPGVYGALYKLKDVEDAKENEWNRNLT